MSKIKIPIPLRPLRANGTKIGRSRPDRRLLALAAAFGAGCAARSPTSHAAHDRTIKDNPMKSPLTAYMQSLGPRSRRPTLVALRRVSRMMSGDEPARVRWENLRHEHVAAIRAALADSRAPATANASLAAVRGVLKAAWNLGLMTTDDYHRAIAVRQVPGSRLPAGRALSLDQVRELLAACRADERDTAAARDLAVFALLFGAGLRRAEAASLALRAYDEREQCVVVVGKGGKERKVYLLRGCGDLVSAWLDLRGRGDGPLLSQVDKEGRIDRARGLSDQGIMRRVANRAAEAELGKITPHDLRRTFVTLLLDAGADVLAIQRLAGHASATTTAKYDRRPEMAAKRAAELVSV